MDPKLVIISFISLAIFFHHPAQSKCVPRNTSHVSPSPSPHPSFNLQPVSSPKHALAYPPEGEFDVVAPTPTSVPPTESAYVPPTESASVPVTESAGTEKDTEVTDTHSGEKPATTNPRSILFPTLSNLIKTDPAVEKICEKTDYPALCITSVSPFLNGKVDPVSVLEISIKACTQYANVAIAAAKAFANAPSTSKQTASLLGDCTDLFSDALDNLKTATDAIAIHDIGTINSMLSAAVTDFVTCEDGFDGEKSPMAEYDSKLSNMVSNCLAVASLI